MSYNVLYINAFVDIAGGELSLYNVLRTLDRAIINPVVVLPREGPLWYLLKRINVQAVIMPLNRLNKRNPLSVLPYILTVYRIVKIIKKRRINIVHLNMSNVSQFGVVAAKLAGVPVICHMRNSSIGEVAFKREMLFFSDLLIAISKTAEDGYKKYLRVHQRSLVLLNGIVLDDYDAENDSNFFRQKYGLSQNVFLIGCVARIDPRKGQHILLEAVAQLRNRYPQIHVFLAGSVKPNGSPEYLAKLKYLVNQYNMCDKVTFGGFINDLIPMYKSFDLFVLPSLWEAFGRVFIEAMAAGKPVIGTTVGGVPEVVADGIMGILVPPNDPSSLANAISKLINDPVLLKSFGKNGRERVEKYFDAKKTTRHLEKIYSEIANRALIRK